MKQCPNPNCILYTRLEELPDAYVKCPGCGGPLMSVSTASGLLDSSRLKPFKPKPFTPQTRQAVSLDPYGPDPNGPDDGNDPYAPVQTYPAADDEDEDDPYAPPRGYGSAGTYGVERTQANSYVTGPGYHPRKLPFPTTSSLMSSQWTTTSKVAFGVGSVLLLVACGLLGWIFSNRFFPQSKVVASPQATETAFAALRPPVNTPIIGQATVQAGIFNPTITAPNVEQQTPLVPAPTQVPPTEAAAQALPTWTALPVAQAPTAPNANPQAPTPQSQGAAPTAPPAQGQPSAGVVEAHMAASVAGDQPRGVAENYRPSDPFGLAVQATFGQGGVTSVLTRWYGPDGALIYSVEKNYTLPGTYYAGFTVRKNGPWTPGNYRVDVHTNGSPTPSYSVPFTVQ